MALEKAADGRRHAMQCGRWGKGNKMAVVANHEATAAEADRAKQGAAKREERRNGAKGRHDRTRLEYITNCTEGVITPDTSGR